MNTTRKPLRGYVRNALNALDEIIATAKPGAALQKEAKLLSVNLQIGAEIPESYKPKHATVGRVLSMYWAERDMARYIDAQVAAEAVAVRERLALTRAVLARVNGA